LNQKDPRNSQELLLKKLQSIFFLLICVCLISACGTWANPSAISLPAERAVDGDKTTLENSDLPHNLREDYYSDLGGLDGASVYTINMTINLDGDVVRVRGTEDILYTNQETVPLESIYFRLIPNMSGDYLAISVVKIDDMVLQPVLEYAGTALRVDLETPLAPEQSALISLQFNEVVPSVMGGNYGLYIYQDEILALDAFFPIIPVYNNEGWNVEDPPQNADMIFADAAFFSVTVDAPRDLVLVAGGRETDRSEIGDRQIVTFEGGPQRDFYLAASQNFMSVSDMVDGTLVTSYFLEEFRDSGEMVLGVGVHALEIFNQRLGQYPYDELDLVSTPMQAGGMEYSNIVALGVFTYDPSSSVRGIPGPSFLEGAAAHEVAHQWFYNQVMNDQIDEPWVDESLVQYATYLYYLDRYGEQIGSGFMGSFDDLWGRVDKEPIPIGLPAKDYSPMEYGAIVYGRGALFFVALSQEMGQDAFDAFLKEYVETYRWKTVEPEDLKSIAESSCACDLTHIFSDWGAIK
jgi:hypothetical protein